MRIIGIEEAVGLLKDGMTVMVGGFMACGGPNRLMDAIAESGLKDLTLICNDTAKPDLGVGKLVVNRQFKKIIASHIGLNPEAGKQFISGETEVVLVPQGTLAEQIRAAGAGLGGVLTPTGVGTVVEEGKQRITINGKDYLLELPLRADAALLFGSVVDKKGNVYYRGSTRNFNPLMATAADIVIVEAGEIVEVGEIRQEEVITSRIFVDYVIDCGANANGGERNG